MAITSSTTPTGSANAYADVGGESARAKLESGKVYRGVITRADADEGLTVRLNSPSGMVLDNCIWFGGIMAGLIGVRSSVRLGIGVPVLVVAGNPAFIIGADSELRVGATGPRRVGVAKEVTAAAATPPATPRTSGYTSYSTPIDLLEGEFEIGNLMGVAVQFLTNIAKMQAGDRASVECHLLRDMVRIVSDSFQHFTALGSQELYPDGGRSNDVTHATAYVHEAWGAVLETDPKAEVNEDDVNKIADTGRWRFSQFKGFLGDFIHAFVTEPEDALGNLAQMRTGKARVHLGTDGSFLLQSTSDITLERVVRVQVPIELKAHHDAEGNVGRDYKNLNRKYLKIWNFGRNFTDAWQTTYQLREYARWLSEFQGFARFHQLDKDWRVPPQSEAPAPDYSNKEKDRTAAGAAVYRDAYACIRILRTGDVVAFDASGSAVNMSGGNVTVSAVRNLSLEAAGDIRIVAGQNLWIKARRHIEISSAVGGFIVKCRSALKMLCELGTVFIKSDAGGGVGAGPGDPEPEIVEGKGIVIDSAISGTLVHGLAGVTIDTPGILNLQPGELSATTGSVKMTAGSVALKVEDLSVTAVGNVGFRTAQFDVNQQMTLNPLYGLSVRQLRTNNIYANGQIFAQKTPLKPEGTASVPPHGNHVRDLADAGADTALHLAEDAEEADAEVVPPDTSIQQARWSLFPAREYVLSDNKLEHLFESLSQQHLRSYSHEDYEAWDWGNDELLAGDARTVAGHPYPGRRPRHWSHTPEDADDVKLDHVSETDPKERNKQTRLHKEPVVFYYRPNA